MTGEDHSEFETPLASTAETPPMVDVVLDDVEGESKRPWGIIAGTGALVLVLGAGLFALAGGESETDTAQAEVTEQDGEVAESEEISDSEGEDLTTTTTGPPESDETDAAADAFPTTTPPAFEAEFAMEDEAMMSDFGFGGGGTTNAVFDGEQFASIMQNSGGWVLRTSIDGLEWVETPLVGIPVDGYLSRLQYTDSTYVAVLESYIEGSGSTQSIATSSNGVSWNIAELPAGQSGKQAGLVGFGVVDGQAIIIRTLFETFDDPYELIMEAGILDQNQLEMFCGFDLDYDNPGPIDVMICDYEDGDYEEPDQAELDALAEAFDNATTQEERDAIVAASEELRGGNESREVVATINPGDPIYDRILAGQLGDDSGMETEVLSGPVNGPFSVVGELPSDGYLNGTAQTDSAMFVMLSSPNEETGAEAGRILTSSTGATWTAAGSIPSNNGGRLQAFGNTLMFTTYGGNGEGTAFVSTNGAVSWVESGLDTELFNTSTQYIGGEAGIVAVTTGGLEPYDVGIEEPFGPGEGPVLEKDGFTLELPFGPGEFTLTAPDGTITVVSEEDLFDGGNEVVQANPINGNLVFIDPETGETLITFTEQDWEAAYGQFEDPPAIEEGEWVEPERGIEVRFSADGQTWTELDHPAFQSVRRESNINPVAVGDDEAILSIRTYNEPSEELFAFEIEGREPTDAELAALQDFENGSESVEYIRIELG